MAQDIFGSVASPELGKNHTCSCGLKTFDIGKSGLQPPANQGPTNQVAHSKYHVNSSVVFNILHKHSANPQALLTKSFKMADEVIASPPSKATKKKRSREGRGRMYQVFIGYGDEGKALYEKFEAKKALVGTQITVKRHQVIPSRILSKR